MNAGTVYTSAAQTYNDNVTLGADTTLTGGTITTNGTLAGGTYGLTVTGNAVFGNGTADTLTGLSALSVSGTTGVYTNTITTSGTQTYTGAVTLGASTTLTASSVSTYGAVVGGAFGLTITGDAVLGNGAADTLTGLSSLSISGSFGCSSSKGIRSSLGCGGR